MKLNVESLENKEFWQTADITLPKYDAKAVIEKTLAEPTWIHFGAGNIFRGFIAKLQQDVLNQKLVDTGIIASETFDFDILDKIYTPYDNLVVLASLKASGNVDKEVIASIAASVKGDLSDKNEAKKLSAIFSAPSLQMVSFTITEKGYALKNMQGQWLEIAISDMEAGPEKPKHAMGVLTSLMLKRYREGALPIALVSMDNCSENGEKLRASVRDIATAWVEKGFAEAGFLAYLADESKVAYPWSMIDKITPRPSEAIENLLIDAGIEDMAPVITERNTFIAPFVNAETAQYLVVEDAFPNGRPPLEKAGVYFADRQTVNDCERMKVMTCLNPLHTALAVFGCLLGYTRIFEEMRDADLKRLVEVIGYIEGMPVVKDPGIINPMEFIAEVIEERFANPFVPDAPQRIATDTSQKMPIRFGETIKAYIARPEMAVTNLTCIPLVISAWFRYLLGVDDSGEEMPVSSDPLLSQLQAALDTVKFGNRASYNGQLLPMLANEQLFGTDLVACGLSDKIEARFVEMLEGKGAIRKTLQAVLAEI